MTNLDPENEQWIRSEAIKYATEGVGKVRFNPDLVIATAVKYAAYITDGTVPEPEPEAAPRPPRAAPPADPTVVKRGRGRPRKTAATGEGG
jgi:hypothetical protein